MNLQNIHPHCQWGKNTLFCCCWEWTQKQVCQYASVSVLVSSRRYDRTRMFSCDGWLHRLQLHPGCDVSHHLILAGRSVSVRLQCQPPGHRSLVTTSSSTFFPSSLSPPFLTFPPSSYLLSLPLFLLHLLLRLTVTWSSGEGSSDSCLIVCVRACVCAQVCWDPARNHQHLCHHSRHGGTSHCKSAH